MRNKSKENHVKPFLKRFNISMFIWVLSEGWHVLKQYVSDILHFEEFVGALDKTNHQNSWLKLSFKCFAQSEFLSFPVLCFFLLILEFLLVSQLYNLLQKNINSNTPHNHDPASSLCYIKKGLYFIIVPNYD